MTATTSSPESGVRSKRIATFAALAVFVLALAAALAWIERWNAWTNPIFAARPHPALPHALLHHHMQPESDLLYALPWESPLFAVTDAVIDRFGRTYSAIMRAQYLFYALAALGLAAAAWARAGARMGAFAGLLALAAPVPIAAALGMDDHALILALAAWSLCAMVVSERMTRPAPALVAGLLAGLAMRWAFVPSSGLLAVATIACAAGCDALAGAVDRYGGVRAWWRMRRRPEAWRAVIGLGAMMAAFAVAAWWRSPNPPLQLGYYSAEAGESAAFGAGAWLAGVPAYALLAARFQLGPVLAATTCVALVVLWRTRHDDRALVTGWILVPILALSLVPKRNAYYGWCALLAAPFAISLLVATIEKTWARVGLAVAIALGAMSWSVARMLAPEPNVPGSATFRHFEQSSMYVLTRPDFTIEGARAPERAMLDALRERLGADERVLVVLLGTQEPFEQLRYHLLMRDADAQLHILALAGRNPPDDARPFFAEVAPSRGVARPFADVVSDAMERLRRQFGSETPISHPTMGYLQRLAEHAGEVEPAYIGERIVVYDRAGGAP
ncbi:MAG: hypothetical protein IT350_16610 [Deltaproteobacteria bacterium]|nr:hypothetical protein [Deltaproteobacteria bacterium]